MAALLKERIYPSALPQQNRNEIEMIKSLIRRYGLPHIILQLADNLRRIQDRSTLLLPFNRNSPASLNCPYGTGRLAILANKRRPVV